MQIEQLPRPRTDTRVSYRVDLGRPVPPAASRAALERARTLDASWVTLPTSSEQPLSEDLLRAAIELGLEPVVWIDARPARSVDLGAFAALCRRYERAGVRYLCIFDRPNTARVWSYEEWRQPGLPARFAGILAPLLETIDANGLCPVVGPLAPGGHYWDLTFLAQLIGTLARESHRGWLDRLVLGVVDTYGRWGLSSQGVNSEVASRPAPYTRLTTEVRSALRVTQWYDALAREHLGRSLPLLAVDALQAADLADVARPPRAAVAASERPSEVVEQIRRGALPSYRLNVSFGRIPDEIHDAQPPRGANPPEPEVPTETAQATCSAPRSSFEHYVLLCPSQSADTDRWTLSGLMGAILPYVGRFRPTVGFSLEEAALASRVTIVGPDADQLRQVEEQLTTAGRLAEAIAAASVTDLKRTMLELATRKARFIRLPE